MLLLSQLRTDSSRAVASGGLVWQNRYHYMLFNLWCFGVQRLFWYKYPVKFAWMHTHTFFKGFVIREA